MYKTVVVEIDIVRTNYARQMSMLQDCQYDFEFDFIMVCKAMTYGDGEYTNGNSYRDLIMGQMESTYVFDSVIDKEIYYKGLLMIAEYLTNWIKINTGLSPYGFLCHYQPLTVTNYQAFFNNTNI